LIAIVRADLRARRSASEPQRLAARA
jgi:hypothetical protein